MGSVGASIALVLAVFYPEHASNDEGDHARSGANTDANTHCDTCNRADGHARSGAHTDCDTCSRADGHPGAGPHAYSCVDSHPYAYAASHSYADTNSCAYRRAVVLR